MTKTKKRNHPLREYTQEYAQICQSKDRIPVELFSEHGVKRGLRDENGKGVLAGLTNISRIDAFKMVDGQKVPCDGRLYYRGYDVIDLVKGFQGKRYGYEEIAYLLLFGELPTREQIIRFNEMLVAARTLPTNFTRDVIMKAPSKDLMNSMTRSVLTLASYDDKVADPSLDNVLRQCMALISEFPMMAVYSYQAYNHYINDDSLYIHRPHADLSTAENILLMLRPDKNTPTWKPGSWTSPWCSTWNTAAATTPPSPPGWSPPRVPTPTPSSRRPCLPSRAPSTAAPTSRWWK